MNENENENDDHDRAVLLSIAACGAMVVAYLLAFSVLTDTDLASHFENGVAPAGTDLAGNRVAAVASIVAALGAWTARRRQPHSRRSRHGAGRLCTVRLAVAVRGGAGVLTAPGLR